MINRTAKTSPFVQETHENLECASLLPTIGGPMLSLVGGCYAAHLGSLTGSLFSVTIGAATLTCTPLVVIVAGLILFGLGLAACLYLFNTQPKKERLRSTPKISVEEQNARDYARCFSKIQQILDGCNVQYEDLPLYEEDVKDDGFGYLMPNNEMNELDAPVYRGKSLNQRDYLLIKQGSSVFFLQQRYNSQPFYWIVNHFPYPNDFGVSNAGDIKDGHLQALRNALNS